ncbi:MAG TPA: hypothetical protein DCM02_14750 [Flavobacterium sp.]|nr:hypothetical protein [Flavobacterium sp.]
MRKYLDPVYLAVTEEAWQSRVYYEIFESLNSVLKHIEDIERDTDNLYKLVRFKFSYELLAQIYNNNPFKNQPEVQEHYTRFFKDKIIPELLRRFDFCPDLCTPLIEDSQCCKFSNNLLPKDVLNEWNLLLEQCFSCDNDLLYLLSPASSKTVIVEPDNILITQKILVAKNVEQLFDVTDFLSKNIFDESHRENRIKQAILICYSQSVLQDGWSSNLTPQDYEFNDFFWQTLERAKLSKENSSYQERFVRSMTQIVYDLDIDIRKHKYGKITIGSKKYTKYSADVFKMGQGSIDTRCSRIFYCKIEKKVHFYEFDPDYHAGE